MLHGLFNQPSVSDIQIVSHLLPVQWALNNLSFAHKHEYIFMLNSWKWNHWVKEYRHLEFWFDCQLPFKSCINFLSNPWNRWVRTLQPWDIVQLFDLSHLASWVRKWSSLLLLMEKQVWEWPLGTGVPWTLLCRLFIISIFLEWNFSGTLRIKRVRSSSALGGSGTACSLSL